MPSLHVSPPYRVVFNNDEEATLLAGEEILARFNGGWNEPVGHANACFFARAGASYETLVEVVQVARDYLRGISKREPQAEQIKIRLEAALQLATDQPMVTDWSELERRRSVLRAALAGIIGNPVSQAPPITNEQKELLGELEKIEFLLSH